jgi:hypothetical protein
MRRLALAASLAGAVAMVAAAPAAALAAGVDRSEFRFDRHLAAPGSGPILFEPNGSMYAHSQPGLSDLRILDAKGRQVAWRRAVSIMSERPRLIPRRIRKIRRHEHGSLSIVRVDLRYRNLPVDELRIEAATGRYDRPVLLRGSNDGRHFVFLGETRLSRYPGSLSAPTSVRSRYRYLQIEIENGSDDPLIGLRIAPFGHSRALLLEGGHPGPYEILYGNPLAGAPEYDFARLPPGALGLDKAVPAQLSPERLNRAYVPPLDTRSFTARHPALVTVALVLAGLALAVGGFIALRRPTSPDANG